MEEIFLRKPTEEDKEEMLQMIEEFKACESILNGHGGLGGELTYEQWLAKVRSYEDPKKLPEGRVLSTQFISVRKTDNKILGLLNIRWELNDDLRLRGGHIGDSIRPLERNKGYATEQIRQALLLCKEKGIKKVLITCKKENIASARTIQKNNGILENEIDIAGEIFQRYWVEL